MGFWEQGKKVIYCRGSGEQRPNFEGNRGSKIILWNREHKKTNFRFLWNRGKSQFIAGEPGNRYPLGGPHYLQSNAAFVCSSRPSLQTINQVCFVHLLSVLVQFSLVSFFLSFQILKRHGFILKSLSNVCKLC